MKHVQAYLSARKDLESSFNHCGDPVKLVQACLNAERPDQAVYFQGGAVKHVHPCLSARKSRESSFNHCGGPVKLVQAC